MTREALITELTTRGASFLDEGQIERLADSLLADWPANTETAEEIGAYLATLPMEEIEQRAAEEE